MDRQLAGREGEEIACRFLMQKGYQLLTRNFRAERAEIDLVMRDGKTIVFVEVKARSTDRYGLGREAVTPRKQQNILRAAQCYLAAHSAFDSAVRFDVAEVDITNGAVAYIENAFGA